MKARFLPIIPIITLFLLLSSARASFGEPWDGANLDEITTAPGFGDSWNRYAWSMVYHEGDLYVGTWNTKLLLWEPTLSGPIMRRLFGVGPTSRHLSRGAEIWKYDLQTGLWQQIVDNGYTTKNNVGFRVAEAYGDHVYFGSVNNDGAQILAVSGGGSVVQVIMPPAALEGLWNTNESIRGMGVYNGNLYIGTESAGGGQLWCYDGTALRHVATLPVLSLAQFEKFGNYLFLGAWGEDSSFTVFRMDGSESVEDVTPNHVKAPDDFGVLSMEVFLDYLFVGTVNYAAGFSLFYITDDEDPIHNWHEVTDGTTADPGFGDMANAYAWVLRKCADALFMGVYNTSNMPMGGTAQLWGSTDGMTWVRLTDDLFPSPWEYGVRTLACDDGALFLGTAATVPGTAFLWPTEGGTRIFSLAPLTGDAP